LLILNRATADCQEESERETTAGISPSRSQKRLKDSTRVHCNTTDRAGAYISRQIESHANGRGANWKPHCETKIRRAGQSRSRKRVRRRECFTKRQSPIYYPSSRLDQLRRVDSLQSTGRSRNKSNAKL
jgi:hypothetical protein